MLFCAPTLTCEPDERDLPLFILKAPGALDLCVACPSQQAELQTELSAHLQAVLPLPKDQCIALSITLKEVQTAPQTVNNHSVSLYPIAEGVKVLRRLATMTSPQDVLCNTLGSVLSLQLYAFIGVDAPETQRSFSVLPMKSWRIKYLRWLKILGAPFLNLHGYSELLRSPKKANGPPSIDPMCHRLPFCSLPFIAALLSRSPPSLQCFIGSARLTLTILYRHATCSNT